MKGKAVFVSMIVCVVVLAALMVGGCGKAKPSVKSITPDSGPPMTVITISGSGFGNEKGTGSVQFDGDAIGVKTWSDTEIVATVPSEMKAGKREVRVNTGSGVSEGIEFEVKEAEQEKAPEPTEPEAKPTTQKEVIVEYATANNLFHPDEQVKQGSISSIALARSSAQNPSWELWSMPAGQGVDIYYFLL